MEDKTIIYDIVDRLEVTSFGDGDMEIQIDDGRYANFAYLSMVQIIVLRDILTEHIDKYSKPEGQNE